MVIFWLVVWNMNFIFPIILGTENHPNWRSLTPSFFRGLGQPPTSILYYSLDQVLITVNHYKSLLTTISVEAAYIVRAILQIRSAASACPEPKCRGFEAERSSAATRHGTHFFHGENEGNIDGCSMDVNLGMSENGVYPQWNSHLVGIMISKTIGFRGTQHFQTHPCELLEIMKFSLMNSMVFGGFLTYEGFRSHRGTPNHPSYRWLFLVLKQVRWLGDPLFFSEPSI